MIVRSFIGQDLASLRERVFQEIDGDQRFGRSIRRCQA